LADLRNDSGPALSADGLHVGQHMFLTGGFTGRGRWSPTVDLTGARVGGIFNFRPSRLKHEFANHRLAVDGLTYIGVPSTNGAEVPVRRDSAPD
jgi:hypothetical protein